MTPLWSLAEHLRAWGGSSVSSPQLRQLDLQWNDMEVIIIVQNIWSGSHPHRQVRVLDYT
jgi:hypothetical protein